MHAFVLSHEPKGATSSEASNSSIAIDRTLGLISEMDACWKQAPLLSNDITIACQDCNTVPGMYGYCKDAVTEEGETIR
jgi:hypothetical protein